MNALSQLISELEREVAPLTSAGRAGQSHRTGPGPISPFGPHFSSIPLSPLRPTIPAFLLHRDLADRFAVVAMVWGPDQRTPIHDHDGVWCVEGVFKGELEITQFEMSRFDGTHCTMTPQGCIHAGPWRRGT